MIENKIWSHKHIPPTAYDKLPYWRFQLFVDDWIKEIEQQKLNEDKQRQEQEAQEKNYKSSLPKMPSMQDFNPSKYKL